MVLLVFEVCTVVRIKIVVLQIMTARTLQGGCKCSEGSAASVGLHHAGDWRWLVPLKP